MIIHGIFSFILAIVFWSIFISARWMAAQGAFSYIDGIAVAPLIMILLGISIVLFVWGVYLLARCQDNHGRKILFISIIVGGSPVIVAVVHFGFDLLGVHLVI